MCLQIILTSHLITLQVICRKNFSKKILIAMSLIHLNQFPLHNISLDLNRIQLVLLILGLVEFVLLYILLDKIRGFFSGIKSQLMNSNSREKRDSKSSSDSEQAEGLDLSSSDMGLSSCTDGVCRGDMEMVLRSLGMFGDGEEASHLPVKLDADEILNIFEEINPQLEEVKQAFDVFDINRDGFIDANELQKVLYNLGLKDGSELENCRRMIRVFDENRDGRIDFNEFVKIMENSFC